MKPKNLYLVLCAAGFLVPYSQLVPWLAQNGSMSQFVPLMLANRISAFFVADVLVSALVLIAFMRTERKRLPIPHAWAPLLALLAVGVSLALPLYLYLRELARERTPERGDVANA